MSIIDLQDQPNRYSSKNLIKRFVKDYLSNYFSQLYLAMLCMVLVAAASAFHVWLVKPALDGIFIDKNHELLFFIPILVVIVALIKGIASYYQNYLIKFIGQSMVNDIQLELYQHLVYSDIEFLKKHSSGNLISKFVNDIANLRNSLANIFTSVAREFLTVVFLVAIMFYNDFTLSIIAFLVFPLAVIPIIKMGKRMRKIAHQTQDELSNYTIKLDEIFRNIRMVKSFCMELYEIKSAKQVLDQILKFYSKAIKTDSLTAPIMEMLSGIAIAAVIWYGGLQVLNGTTSPGGFFSFIIAFIAAYKPVKSLADLNVSLQTGLASAKRVFQILDTQTKIENKKYLHNLVIKKGDIEFRNVSFNHKEDHITIDGLSLNIKAGQFVALVGSSGSGKSTIIDLILRFYDPLSGEILIDNHNIRDSSPSSVRQSISLVSQDIMLFDTTIKENILYGNIDATDKEVEWAANIAAAHDFIKKLPDGYNTQVGQHGLELSGGQRQRICIARAILKKSKILIFDEATSSLDQISEERIKSSIDTLRNNRTIIVVAHRLSTILNADTIYVVKQGAIVERGSHQQLLEKQGEYFKLYNKQTHDNKIID
ncbi:MAG: ABC transporter ATP-binding protein [Alphaproteobacteria bacterium]|jgi:subfamily B ATP-binding cassette protein MsbA